MTEEETWATEEIMTGYDVNKWDWSKAIPFSETLVEKYIQHLKHTGTGKDGIHNFRFRFGAKYVIKYLVTLFDAFCNGIALPTDINEGLFCFLE